MEKPRPEPARPVPPVSDLGLVVHRCPYCREGLGAGDAAVSCAGCNARHHTACWDEHQACASCGHGARLVPEGSTRPSAPAGARRQRAVVAAVVGVGLFTLAAVSGLVFFQRARKDAERAKVRALAEAREADRARESELQAMEAEALARARRAEVAAARTNPLGLAAIATPEGLEVVTVFPDSRAARAGLRPGDVLLELIVSDVDAFDKRFVLRNADAFGDLLDELRSDVMLALQLQRDGAEQRVRLPRR